MTSARGHPVARKVYGDYPLNLNVAVEAGGMDLGHVDEAAGKIKGQGLFVDVVGNVPIAQDWSVLGQRRRSWRRPGLRRGAAIQAQRLISSAPRKSFRSCCHEGTRSSGPIVGRS